MKRFRYGLGNFLRFLSSPLKQYTVSPDQISTIFGSNLGSSGWNHIRLTLEEYDSNPSIAVNQTTLWKYMKNFKRNSK